MNQRLQSIDILRGLTVMLMIIVNSPGTWEHVAPPFGVERTHAYR